MKREDNKHTIAKIYGLCVFQVIFRYINNKLYENAVLIDISFSIETIKYIFPELFCDKNGEKGVRSSLYKPIIKCH